MRTDATVKHKRTTPFSARLAVRQAAKLLIAIVNICWANCKLTDLATRSEGTSDQGVPIALECRPSESVPEQVDRVRSSEMMNEDI